MLVVTPKPAPSAFLFISVDATSVCPYAQAKTIETFIIPLFLSP